MMSLLCRHAELSPRAYLPELMPVLNTSVRSKERSIGANALASASGWFVSTLAGFIALPFVVGGLGAETYGLLALVYSFTGYLAVMDLGLGQAVILAATFPSTVRRVLAQLSPR